MKPPLRASLSRTSLSRPSPGRVIRASVTVALIALWMVTLRPQWLGGPATFVIVQGDSMLPVYELGDLLVLHSQPAYAVGDPVAYRVPAGEIGAGRLVIHRVVEITDNAFHLQGDNNPAPDPWHPTQADVAGSVVLRVPGAGRLVAMLLNPAVAGAIAAAVVVMAGLMRGPLGKGATRPSLRRPSPALEPPGTRAAPAGR